MLSSRATARLKIFLLGDQDVGKSLWLARLLGERPPSNEAELLRAGRDLKIIKDVSVGDISAEFICMNASADLRYEKIVDGCIAQHQDAYLVFYNISSTVSFDGALHHLNRIKSKAKNGDAIFFLMGLHFGGHAEVSEDDAAVAAQKFRSVSWYGINPQIEASMAILLAPLHYIVRHTPAVKINVPQLDFRSCIKEVDRALRFCKDEERAQMLEGFKRVMEDFACFGEEVTPAHFDEMKRECYAIVHKAQEILDGAFPERVKLAVLAVATTALLFTASACGLALLNVITLPLLTGVLIAGCVLAGAGGVATLGYTIFKAKENAIYSSLVSKAEKAVASFPGVSLTSRQE